MLANSFVTHFTGDDEITFGEVSGKLGWRRRIWLRSDDEVGGGCGGDGVRSISQKFEKIIFIFHFPNLILRIKGLAACTTKTTSNIVQKVEVFWRAFKILVMSTVDVEKRPMNDKEH